MKLMFFLARIVPEMMKNNKTANWETICLTKMVFKEAHLFPFCFFIAGSLPVLLLKLPILLFNSQLLSHSAFKASQYAFLFAHFAFLLWCKQLKVSLFCTLYYFLSFLYNIENRYLPTVVGKEFRTGREIPTGEDR